MLGVYLVPQLGHTQDSREEYRQGWGKGGYLIQMCWLFDIATFLEFILLLQAESNLPSHGFFTCD